jgi:hypothetical protein
MIINPGVSVKPLVGSGEAFIINPEIARRLSLPERMDKG